MPGKARRIDLAGARAAVEERIDTLGAARFPSQAIQSLRAHIIGMLDQTPVREAGPVEVVAVGVRRECSARHGCRPHQQTAALVEILDASFGILSPGRLAETEQENRRECPASRPEAAARRGWYSGPGIDSTCILRRVSRIESTLLRVPLAEAILAGRVCQLGPQARRQCARPWARHTLTTHIQSSRIVGIHWREGKVIAGDRVVTM